MFYFPNSLFVGSFLLVFMLSVAGGELSEGVWWLKTHIKEGPLRETTPKSICYDVKSGTII